MHVVLPVLLVLLGGEGRRLRRLYFGAVLALQSLWPNCGGSPILVPRICVSSMEPPAGSISMLPARGYHCYGMGPKTTGNVVSAAHRLELIWKSAHLRECTWQSHTRAASK